MIGRKLTGTLVAFAMVALPATPSQAFCHLFGRCAKPTTIFYAAVRRGGAAHGSHLLCSQRSSITCRKPRFAR